jgi:hypothetical protein
VLHGLQVLRRIRVCQQLTARTMWVSKSISVSRTTGCPSAQCPTGTAKRLNETQEHCKGLSRMKEGRLPTVLSLEIAEKKKMPKKGHRKSAANRRPLHRKPAAKRRPLRREEFTPRAVARGHPAQPQQPVLMLLPPSPRLRKGPFLYSSRTRSPRNVTRRPMLRCSWQ